MDMSHDRWRKTCNYLNDVFGRPDDQLSTLMQRATRAGLPDIAIDHAVGRLLALLASTTNAGRGARTIIEVGTLAGCSALWLARALAPEGRLITIEIDPAHAAFAQDEFRRAGLADRIDLRVGPALHLLPDILGALDQPLDLAFLDAVKTEYATYADLLIPRLAPGGLLIADNALGAGAWWIDDPQGASPDRDAINAFNRRIASDQRLQTAAVANREGLLIARRTF